MRVAAVGRERKGGKSLCGIVLLVPDHLPLAVRSGLGGGSGGALASDAAGDVGEGPVHQGGRVDRDDQVADSLLVGTLADLILAPLDDKRSGPALECLLVLSSLLGVLPGDDLGLLGLLRGLIVARLDLVGRLADPLEPGGLGCAAGARGVAELGAGTLGAVVQGDEGLHALGQLEPAGEPRQLGVGGVGPVVADRLVLLTRGPGGGVHGGEGHTRLHDGHRGATAAGLGAEGLDILGHGDHGAGSHLGELDGHGAEPAAIRVNLVHLRAGAVAGAPVGIVVPHHVLGLLRGGQRLGVAAALVHEPRGVQAVLAVLQPPVVVGKDEEIRLTLGVALRVHEEVKIVAGALVQGSLRGSAVLVELVGAGDVVIEGTLVDTLAVANLPLGPALGGPLRLADDVNLRLGRAHAERLLPGVNLLAGALEGHLKLVRHGGEELPLAVEGALGVRRDAHAREHVLVDLVGSLGGVRRGVDGDPPLSTLAVGAHAKLEDNLIVGGARVAHGPQVRTLHVAVHELGVGDGPHGTLPRGPRLHLRVILGRVGRAHDLGAGSLAQLLGLLHSLGDVEAREDDAHGESLLQGVGEESRRDARTGVGLGAVVVLGSALASDARGVTAVGALPNLAGDAGLSLAHAHPGRADGLLAKIAEGLAGLVNHGAEHEVLLLEVLGAGNLADHTLSTRGAAG
mmetsp:Transcript_9491/g.36925  ORF Transcript_9491/g.36925 Transcript_9491/m.36925 type:complete len:683 (-) Transcript_9491:2206-4254(-)